jgi:hypothetical protein
MNMLEVGATPHLNMVELGKHARNRTNVLDCASVKFDAEY